ATTVATETTVLSITASTAETSATTPASSPSTAETTTATTATTAGEAQTTAAERTTSQSSTNPANPGTPSSSTETSATVSEITPLTTGSTSPDTTSTSHMPGQDSSSHSATTPTATLAAASTTAQQPSSTATGSASLGTTSAASGVRENVVSSSGAVPGAGTSSASTQTQGNQILDHSSNTPVSTTVPRTDSSQSSKDCVVPPSQCITKQPPSSSSSSVQGATPSSSPGSTSKSAMPLTGSSSISTTLMSSLGSKATVTEAATTTAPGTDQSTHGVGSAAAKPTSASQSPATAQPPAPAPGDQTDQTGSFSQVYQQPNISLQNELICKDQVRYTSPTIYLRRNTSCADWKKASENISFFESFCSTAQHEFNSSRDRCTVTVAACEPQSHHWAVWVVLHLPLDSEEVFKELKKKAKLDELGILNITSEKMVEDMTINDKFSTPLIITIITLAGSLLLIAAIYGCHQRFSQKKDQQRLTEEMQTMENGYHDNPTLEVMETSSEMQEKKVNLNGELGDSWIVPLDTLMKEDLEEEEDTHL
ncbi:PODXL protein, partial [Orthonyx spaldingii]|nr:PODXL protein [Orthonyx spaldingii]